MRSQIWLLLLVVALTALVVMGVSIGEKYHQDTQSVESGTGLIAPMQCVKGEGCS